MPFNLDEEVATTEPSGGGFNFDDVDPDEFERGAAQRNAQRLITEQALAAGESAAGEVRQGRQVTRYGTQWDEVRQRLEDNNPNHGIDLSRAEEAFQQVREAGFQQGLLKPPGEGQGERDELRHYMQHVPVAGHIFNVARAGEERAVRNRIEAGTASQEDYFRYQQRLRSERYEQDRPGLQQGLEGLARIPTFSAEFGINPFGRAAAAATTARLGGGLAARGAGLAAGSVVGAATMPANAASSIFQRINPRVGEENASAADVFTGYLDHQIEVASEMSGEALVAGVGRLAGGAAGLAGRIAPRVPGGVRAAAIANALTKWGTNRLGSEGFQRSLRATGFDGLFGEWLEERAGEVARGATGVESNYGLTGRLASGDFGRAADQLLIEGITLGGWSAITGLVGVSGAERALARMQARGMGRRAAQQAISQATTQVLQNPAAVANVPAPLQQYAQSLVDTFHQPAQGPQPGVEAQAEEAEAPQLPAQGPSPGLEATPAENAVPSETVPAEESQESATEALVAPAPAGIQAAPTTTIVQLPAPAPPVAPQAKPGALEAKPTVLRGLSDRMDEWRGVQEKLKAGEPLTAEEQSVEPITVSDIVKAAKLNPRQSLIISGRLQGRSQPDIGKDLGVTREAVRQAEAKALKQIKKASGSKIGSIESIAQLQAVRKHGAAPKGVSASTKLKDLGFSKKEIDTLKLMLNSEIGYLRAGDSNANEKINAIVDSFQGKKRSAVGELAAEMLIRSKTPKKKGVAVAELEGGRFTPEQQAAINHVNSPLTSPELRAKLMDKAVSLILKEKFDAANKELGDAGTVGLTEEDYQAIGGLSFGRVTKATVEAAKAAQAKQPPTGAKGIQAEPEVRLAAGRAGVAEPKPAAPVTAEELAKVSAISPAHAALVNTIRGFILSTQVPSAKKVEFFRNQVTNLTNMPAPAAALYAQYLKKLNYHVDAQTLTNTVARESAMVRQVQREGDIVPGVWNRGTGVMNLDGDSEFGTGARVAGHEIGHAIGGPTEAISNSADVQQAYVAEALPGTIGNYARENTHEFTSEFLGLVWSGEMTSADAQARLPLMYQAMLSRGLINPAEGKSEMRGAPQDVFDYSVNEGTMHADVTRLARTYGPKDVESSARAQISATGAAEPRVPQPLIVQAQDRLEDSLAVLDRLTAKQVPFGSAPQRKGADLRTVFWGMMGSARQAADKWFSQGVTEFRLNPDGTRTEVTTTKPATWITEGIDAKRLQLGKDGETSQWGAMLIANHVVSEVDTGANMMQGEDEVIQAKGVKKVATASPEQVATFRAFLEDVRTKEPTWYAQAMESAARYTEYMNAMRQSLVAVGYHKQSEVDKMIAAFPDFVPLARVMDETPFKTELNKARKGSGRRFVDPLTTLRARTLVTNYFVARQLINNTLWDGGAVQQGPRGVENFWTEKEKAKGFDGDVTDIDRALKALGMEDDLRAEVIGMLGDSSLAYMNTDPWHPTGKNTYSIRVDGAPKTLEIHDRSLYEVLTGQQGGDALSNLAKGISGFPGVAQLASIQKGGAVFATTIFPVRNFFRDPFTYFQNEVKNQGFAKAFSSLIHGSWDAFQAKGRLLLGKPIDKTVSKLYFEGRGESNRAFAFAPRGEGEAAMRLMRGESLGGLKGASITAINKVKDFFEFVGSQEHGGRIAAFTAALEEMGYTEAQIEKAMQASPNESPIPLNAILYATLRGAKSTTDFSKKGSWVKEWDKSVPFFGPHITGMTQEARNWQDAVVEMKQTGKFGPKMKGMAGVAAVLLTMEILHWWKYKDDDWYNELDANQRYRWFILGRKGKGIWGVPKPHGLSGLAAGYLQELLRLESGNAPRFDMATGNVPNELIPRAAPVGLGEAFQVARNTSWSGMPIVPSNEDRHLGDFDKWWKYRAPYVLDQLSGGFLSERVFRMPWDALTASSVSPHQSVTDAYERLNQLDQERFAYRERGVPFPREAEYRRLNQITTALRNISQAIRGDRRVGNTIVKGEKPSEERIAELRRRQVELARMVQVR